MRGKRGVGKSRVVKAIHLGFNFLKQRSKLIIATLTEAATANIGGAIIHNSLKMDERMKNNNNAL